MNATHFGIFARAFCALLYSPTIALSHAYAKVLHLYSGQTILFYYLAERCMFSMYRDVLSLYNTFGPVIPVPIKLKENVETRQFYELMVMDVFATGQKVSRSRQSFHRYKPKDIGGKLEHLSSNIPNFLSLISIAVLLYDCNDVHYDKWFKQDMKKKKKEENKKKSKGNKGAKKNKSTETVEDDEDESNCYLFEIQDDDKYIMLTNKRQVCELFHTKALKVDKEKETEEEILVDDKSFEAKFRSKFVVKKGCLKSEETICYVNDLQLKIGFVLVKDWKARNKSSRPKKFYTLLELAEIIFDGRFKETHPFWNMDSSFDLMIAYLKDKEKLIDFLRLPVTKIQDSAGGKAATLKKQKANIFSEIFQDGKLFFS